MILHPPAQILALLSTCCRRLVVACLGGNMFWIVNMGGWLHAM